MNKYLLLVLLYSTQIFAQNTNEKILNTNITNVTVFLQSAQITRTGKTNLTSGKTLITIEKLSPYMDDKSVQVKGEGNFTVLSVTHKLDYLSEKDRNSETKNLQDSLEELNFEIERLNGRLEVLSEKESLLDKNKNLNGESSSASLTQLKQAIEFYDKELSEIKKDRIQTRNKIQQLNKERLNIQSQIADVRNQGNLPAGKIEIRVEASGATPANFNISYLVDNAGWFPNYDLRVDDIDKPLTMDYKADVYQNTGVDWNDVKLKFSNGNPNQSGVAPELNTWYLNYARNTRFQKSVYNRINPDVNSVIGNIIDEDGQPLPGANIIVKGSSVGTQTDFDGNYKLTLPNNAQYLVYSYVGFKTQEIPITKNRIDLVLEYDSAALDEVVVTGYGLEGSAAGMNIRGQKSVKKADKITTSTIENQTTVEFEVPEPYTITSNGEKLAVDLKQFDIETTYEYYTVPKIEKAAFLIANISNWDQYNLLEGEANLFFENSYVGRTVLDAKSLRDTLSISLGRDRGIVIGREKIDEFSKRKFIGSNSIETREFRIMVRNKKSQPIVLNIYDQIPIPAISEIDVSDEELSGGYLNEKTGEVKWTLNLQPQDQKDLVLKYEVKYPKGEDVILE